MNLSELRLERSVIKEKLKYLTCIHKIEKEPLQKKLYAISHHISALESKERRKKTLRSVKKEMA